MSSAISSEPAIGDALPLKVNALVLVVASRCNLNCSYCYVYNGGDETWRTQPAVMSAAVVDGTLRRVKAHALKHKLEEFLFVFHGGEPLLAGMDFFREYVAAAHRALRPHTRPLFRLQTNGVLLTKEWCELLASLRIGLGVSLDGGQEYHNKYRVDHAGRGSYPAVRRGVELARATTPTTPPSILTVIDPSTDPIAVYEHHRALDAEHVDFILPDATWDRPPYAAAQNRTPYADWLVQVFDRWFFDRPQPMRIRIFEHFMALLLGADSPLDTMGTGRNEVFAIQTDGGIEPVGSLNLCGHGFTKLGANVLEHEFEVALDTPLARAYHLSGEQRCATCQKCPLGRVCGGGYLPWRYRREGGFDNPAVYCHDLAKIITHIHARMSEVLPPALRARLIDRVWTYQEVLDTLPPAVPRHHALRVVCAERG